MILKQIYEDAIAQAAYLVGCTETGEALVVDPTVDVERYVREASAEGLRIVAVAETHVHADFVSGGRALAARTGATLHVSGEGGHDWRYRFAGEAGVREMRDGDVIRVGNVRLDVVHTPGHTPEHLMFVVTDERTTSEPIGLLTGDFLFVGDVGRPDLLDTAAGRTNTRQAAARQLYASRRRLADLPDHLIVWPGHGAGSACGKSLGGVRVSSLGYERRTNWALGPLGEAAFVARVLDGQPDVPLYFGEMKRVNLVGAEPWPGNRELPALDQPAVTRAVADGLAIVDTRPNAASTGMLPGSVVIPPGRNFTAWAGSVLPGDAPFVIAAEQAGAAHTAWRALALIGIADATGWASPATVSAHASLGGPLDRLPAVDAPRHGDTVIDVRTTAEWERGHVEQARHAPLARLTEHLGGLDPSMPLVVYCQAGPRSIVAATTLKRLGYTKATYLAGGYEEYSRRHGEIVAVGADL